MFFCFIMAHLFPLCVKVNVCTAQIIRFYLFNAILFGSLMLSLSLGQCVVEHKKSHL